MKGIPSAISAEHLDARFARATPRELLVWAVERFHPRLALATSFGPQSIVLMHQIASIRRDVTVFYLDTDLLFEQTYALRDELAGRLGLTFTRVPASLTLEEQAERHGEALWARAPDLCCELRKVRPLRRVLAGQRAWITGIRASQTALRARARVVEWDAANGLLKLNPLLHWRDEQVRAYLREHDLPTNPLYDEGYPSIGCVPCTRRVRCGEDPRAGRWAGLGKTECGIHVTTAAEPAS